MNQPLLNRIEIVNETFTLCSMYFLLFFTSWCTNPEIESLAGELYMYFLIGIAVLNFLMIAFEMLTQLFRKKYFKLKGIISRKVA